MTGIITYWRMFFCTAGLSGMAACGGGEGAVSVAGGGGAPLAVAVVNSAPNVPVPAGSQRVIGSHAISFFSVRDSQIQKTNGAERLSDGALTVADELAVFTGNSGYQNGGMTGDIGTLNEIPVAGSYNTAKIYSGGIADGSNQVFYAIQQGVYGIEAPAGAITSSAIVTYLGDAIGRHQSETLTPDSTYFADGTSNLVVDFGAGTADLTMDQFNLNTNFDVFDGVRVNGMRVNGNQLDGGTVELIKNGTAVSGLGANTESVATGSFLGSVSGAGVPDEVGGQVYARGNDGAFVATFVGD